MKANVSESFLSILACVLKLVRLKLAGETVNVQRKDSEEAK